MKAVGFRAIWALLACAALPLAVRADELDELLNSEPAATASDSPVAEERLPTFDDLTIEPRAAADSSFGAGVGSTLPETSVWQTAGASSGRPAADHAQPVAQESAPLGISLVPEPSAVALAALALLYFLVFGRRRTLG